ncbi:putative siderophore transport system ATP-binding protein YusV [Marinomonas gallaica]|uniref:Siderophore transport system ATP-binding protein YusV n=1 Tax=Marinomonas gallaica TaxID=1806667 RepID=A0A1C3JR93_9GAMM|nr:ABC transporter ATP-binding protein [Marinomonas gallaica]SBT17570.1 putative siderophore transport system ATP-binding protein YusV [Marinomonas gallaica]SBT19762.1 putative siderophore transport system ATP-binding protein YusV [Marinomonas gallaica]
MLEVRNLSLAFDDLVLADNMNFTLDQGKTHVIIGPNGTGKSSLLKTLFGDIQPQSGEVLYQGAALTKATLNPWRQRFGYMPQDINLDVGLSVLEVVLLGQLNALSLKLGDSLLEEALQALDQIGLLHLANRDVRTLSGGQCQMILFAQALMRKPEILMLDEPVSALDLHFQQVLLDHLDQQTKQKGWISLMILHDLNLAAQYADNLLVLKGGKVVAQGAPKDILTADLIEDVYGVKADIQLDSLGVPFVRTQRRGARAFMSMKDTLVTSEQSTKERAL